MAFTKKIKAESPDKYLKAAVSRREDGQAQLARLAHVNALQSETEDALQLCSSQVETSIDSGSGLPTAALSKTSTRIQYADGVVMEGYELIMLGTMGGGTDTIADVYTVNIPEVPGQSNEGFYIPWNLTGVTICEDETLGGRVINAFANGAEFQNLTGVAPFNGAPADSVSVTETNSGGADIDFTLSVIANNNPSEGSVVARFEFLVYAEVTPVLT